MKLFRFRAFREGPRRGGYAISANFQATKKAAPRSTLTGSRLDSNYSIVIGLDLASA